MGKDSRIEWTDHTFNPWRGWGKTGSRPIAAESYWQQPLRWNRDAQQAGVRRRVFCSSLADVFEGYDTMPKSAWAAVCAARFRLFHLVERTPWLDWLLLTKRPENALTLAPERWSEGWPDNVWIGTSVEDQSAADTRIPHLLQVPARVRFLSCEPLLGPVDLSTESGYCYCGDSRESHRRAFWGDHSYNDMLQPMPDGIHWVIVGGESGSNARPMHPDWVRGLRDACQAYGVAFFFKQWGEWLEFGSEGAVPGAAIHVDRLPHFQFDDGTLMFRVGKARAGRLLDGRTWDEFPEVRR